MIAALEDRLAKLCSSGETITYGALARDLGLTGPGTISQLAAALEHLMEHDAAAGHPLRAAIVVGRLNNHLPAPGFFAKAAALGFDVTEQAAFVARERARLASLFAQNPLNPDHG